MAVNLYDYANQLEQALKRKNTKQSKKHSLM